MFTHSPFRLIKLPNNPLLKEEQFFAFSHIFLIIFSEIFYHSLSKMSALNKKKPNLTSIYELILTLVELETESSL